MTNVKKTFGGDALVRFLGGCVAVILASAVVSVAQARPTDEGTFPQGRTIALVDAGQQLRDVNGLTEVQQQLIQAAAVQQASIWSDTILEGDFEAAGDTRVDRVQGVYSGETLLGYRVTYSETAWSTQQCNYDHGHKETLSACIPGRISESMYLSTDLKDAQRDERDFAHFLN